MVDVLSLLLNYTTQRLIFAYRENADYTEVNRYISVNKELNRSRDSVTALLG
jgi:hypothetical protein